MLVEVKVPQLSESVSEATLLDWHKKEGEAVNRDENLIDIETDKIVMELPAPANGVIAKIIKTKGGSVKSGEIIATIDTEAKPTVASTVSPAVSKTSATSISLPPKATESKAMPAARKMMAENDLTANDIAATGRGGRITKGDVVEHLEKPQTSSPSAKPSLPQPPTPVDINRIIGDRPEQRVPMSRLRARVAERLVQAQSTAAILTTFNEVNMQPVIDIRNKYKDKFEKEHGIKLGFMSFFVKAAVYALKKYPIVNASVDGNDIVYHGYFDLGIAVSSPRGLVVPILRNVDQLSFAQVEKEIANFSTKAKEGKLAIEDLTGGTFSISNGGVFGSMLSTPIINPPQSAILGIHATKERPIVENGQVVIRPVNYLALSYDHRIIDGREAVLSLVAIKESLEDPARLLLEI